MPRPSQRRGKNCRVARIPAWQEAKVSPYEAMRHSGPRKAGLAGRLGWQKSQVDRLLRLDCASRLDRIERAFRVLGKRLAIEVRYAT